MTDETQVPAPVAEQSPPAVAAEQPKDIPDPGEATQEQETQPNAEAAQAEQSQEAGEESEGQEAEGDKPKRPSRSQRLKKQLVSALEELETLRAQAEAARTEKPAPAKPQAASDDPEPKEADYPDYFAFQAARTDWVVRNTIRSTLASERERQQTEQYQTKASELRAEAAQEFAERLEETKERISDYDEVMEGIANIRVRDEILDLLQFSEKGPLLVYELAKNPTKLRELNRMSPFMAAKEIGRLEATVNLPQAKKTTKAPPPVKPLNGGGAAPPKDIRALADSDDITEYARARDRSERARAKA